MNTVKSTSALTVKSTPLFRFRHQQSPGCGTTHPTTITVTTHTGIFFRQDKQDRPFNRPATKGSVS